MAEAGEAGQAWAEGHPHSDHSNPPGGSEGIRGAGWLCPVVTGMPTDMTQTQFLYFPKSTEDIFASASFSGWFLS